MDVTIDEVVPEAEADHETGIVPHMLTIIVNDKPGVLNLVRFPPVTMHGSTICPPTWLSACLVDSMFHCVVRSVSGMLDR